MNHVERKGNNVSVIFFELPYKKRLSKLGPISQSELSAGAMYFYQNLTQWKDFVSPLFLSK